MIEANQRAHKEPQPPVTPGGALDVLRATNAALGKHALKLSEIGWGQRLVHPQLVNVDVVLMRGTEGLSLARNFT